MKWIIMRWARRDASKIKYDFWLSTRYSYLPTWNWCTGVRGEFALSGSPIRRWWVCHSLTKSVTLRTLPLQYMLFPIIPFYPFATVYRQYSASTSSTLNVDRYIITCLFFSLLALPRNSNVSRLNQFESSRPCHILWVPASSPNHPPFFPLSLKLPTETSRFWPIRLHCLPWCYCLKRPEISNTRSSQLIWNPTIVTFSPVALHSEERIHLVALLQRPPETTFQLSCFVPLSSCLLSPNILWQSRLPRIIVIINHH